uniref:EF hand family protein n=2 Tax=Oryza TaxID=4527 RepID=Q2RAN2_ORYSJ|nr:EF hand family protein [Oryza sativa Japonica Group]
MAIELVGYFAMPCVTSMIGVAKCDDKDARYEDCEKMIHVFDKDGDGRISLDEFRAV